MISHWRVLQEVANQNGSKEDAFDSAAEKLVHVKSGKKPLVSLENNIDRIEKRVAREHAPLQIALERINGVADFQDVAVLQKLSEISMAVCRILKRGSPIGTGFLVSPEILLTNHHVIERAEDASDLLAEFNYELDANRIPKKSTFFSLNADKFFLTSSLERNDQVPTSGLDFTLVGVESSNANGDLLSSYQHVPLDGNLGKIIKGESCVIIQHPNGLPKKIVLKDTAFFAETDTRIVYETDSLPGASGSPVFALGTCEIIALHHSGLPRTDELNRVLTKSGELATPDTPDNQIDWIGNEGIKVSCIVKALRESNLRTEMEKYREELLRTTKAMANELAHSKEINMQIKTETVSPDPNETPDAINSPSTTISMNSKTTAAPLQYFEVRVSRNRTLRDDWEEKATSLIPGLIKRQPLISAPTDPVTERMEYLAVASAQNPWELAAFIENLPHIESCTPDLEVATDIGIAEQTRSNVATESVIFNAGTAEVNEREFIDKWKNTKWYKDAIAVHKSYFRQWNWLAVNCPADSLRVTPEWTAIRGNLSKLRFVQLDTGYTQHSKSYGGYDLDKDYDFIDDDNDAQDRAKDISARLFLKFPSHGTRTASLTIGGSLDADPDSLDGNSGILTFQNIRAAKLIPYRVARSVILLGRAKQLVNAASLAIQQGTDVMFMCMGSYPRPMLEAIAKEAYKNGVIWVCAAGNEVEMVVAPAMYPGTIAVAGTNPEDLPWAGSSNGPAVDIAAPGESVYVPFVDKNGKEIMVYGDGTSYATPHVASAAMLWKAKHADAIRSTYTKPWQIVEAFRYCLTKSRRKPKNWPEKYFTIYGKGILDIEKLLNTPLPQARVLKDAYENHTELTDHDLGIKEAVHYIWNVVKRKLRGGPTESFTTPALTERGRAAMSAFANAGPTPITESSGAINTMQANALLRDFFQQ